MKDENWVKAKMRAIWKSFGVEVETTTTGGFGASGWPDQKGLYLGVYIGAEAKFGKNTPTELQKKRLRYIRDNGGVALLIYETNYEDLRFVLATIKANHGRVPNEQIVKWLNDNGKTYAP